MRKLDTAYFETIILSTLKEFMISESDLEKMYRRNPTHIVLDPKISGRIWLILLADGCPPTYINRARKYSTKK
jgi:hypothetical protein